MPFFEYLNFIVYGSESIFFAIISLLLSSQRVVIGQNIVLTTPFLSFTFAMQMNLSVKTLTIMQDYASPLAILLLLQIFLSSSQNTSPYLSCGKFLSLISTNITFPFIIHFKSYEQLPQLSNIVSAPIYLNNFLTNTLDFLSMFLHFAFVIVLTSFVC